MAELTSDELLMLQFEDRRWRRGGPTVGAIRRRLRMTPEAYRQRLDVLIDRPEALAVAPQAVRRLRAQRDDRHRPAAPDAGPSSMMGA